VSERAFLSDRDQQIGAGLCYFMGYYQKAKLFDENQKD